MTADADLSAVGVTFMKKRTFLAGAMALALAGGAVLAPSFADAATMHGGGGHGGGGHGGGGFHGGGHGGGGYRVGAYGGGGHRGGGVYRGGGYGYGGGGYGGWNGGYYAGACGPMQLVLGLCGP
jgi:hypothetical protein